MNPFDADVQRLRAVRRGVALFALLLPVSTLGAFLLAPLLTPMLSPIGTGLLVAVVVGLLCVPLLWYVLSRATGLADLPERLRAEQVLLQTAECVLTVNGRGQLLSLNPAAERLFGYRSAEVRNQPVTLLVTDPPTSENRKGIHDSLPVGTILGLAAGAREVVGRRKDGEAFPVELTGSTVAFGEERVSVVFARDVSKRKQAQRYLTAHYATTCILAEAPSLAEALPRILESICEALRCEAGVFWRVDRAAGLLRCGELYQSPNTGHPAWQPAEPLTCKPKQGLAGRVWSAGKPCWVEDLPGTEDWPCLALAQPLRLRGAFAFPVVTGGEVAGVMTVFSCRKLRKDEQLLAIMGEAGKQIGQFITRKQAEEQLQRSEERFRQLAENIHEVFWMADAEDGRVLYLSPSYEEVWGRPASTQWDVRRPSLVSVHPEDRDRVASAWEKQQRGEDTSEEYRILRPDGSVRWVWDRAFPVRDAEGGVYRVAGVAADITARRRTEEALRETTQTLQALIQAAPVAINIIDLEGKVRLWNPAAETMLRWGDAESLGRPLLFLPAEGGADSAACLEGVLRGETIHGQGTRCRRKDGGLLEVSLSAAPLRDNKGAIFGAVVILMDLTEQKQLEERLRQAQKMEAVGQLAGGVAHDFNNLLTIITGYCEILIGNSRPDDPALRFLGQIKQAGDRAAGLTRQLLAFGRKQTLQVQVLDLNKLVANLEGMLRRLIGEDIEVMIEAAPRLGHVKADPVQIEQVLLNLAVNARDAMPDGGRLTIATADVELDEAWAQRRPDTKPGPYVQLTVRDTGCGMDGATRAHIFEPFFTTKETGKGTGLGLATVYGIVKQSEGHIEVESEPNCGATFRIYLPRLEAARQGTDEPETPPPTPEGKETILLVEDEDSVRRIMRLGLESSGYTVLGAGSGSEALKICATHEGDIALLVTDVIMPQMNGRQLVEQAVRLRPDLSVLYISGYTDNVLDNHGILASGTPFLQKPVTPRVLARKVREVLDHGKTPRGVPRPASDEVWGLVRMSPSLPICNGKGQ